MTARVQHLRLTTTNQVPVSLSRTTGELWVNYPDLRLGYIDGAKQAQDLLAIRRHASTATYATADFVTQGGQMWRAKAAIPPKAFAPGDWDQMLTSAGGTTVTGPLLITATGGVTPRSLQDRWSEPLSVRDFGAVMDGVANDATAFSNARAATRDWGTIRVPKGRLLVLITPTAGPTTPVLWQMDGVVTGPTGLNPAVSMGTDVVENFFGTKFFGRRNSFPGVGPTLRVDGIFNHTGGISGNTVSSLTVNGSSSNNFGEATFNLISNVTSSKTGGGNVVALIGYATRTSGGGHSMFGANIYAVDTSGGSSITTGPLIGSEIDIGANDTDTGGATLGYITQSGQGIRVIIDALVAKQIPGGVDAQVGWGVRVATPGSGASIGRMFASVGAFYKAAFSTEFAAQGVGANAIWLKTGHTIALDSGAATTLSSNGGTITAKGALTVTGQAGVGAAAVGAIALELGAANAGVTIGLRTANAAFTTAIRMGQEQKLAFEGTDQRYLQFTAPGGNRLRYVVGASERFTIFDNGNVTVAGALNSASLGVTGAMTVGGGLTVTGTVTGGAFSTTGALTVSGNATVGGSLTTGSHVVSSNNVYARGGTVYVGVSDRAHLASDNATYTSLNFADNYRLEFTWANTSLNFINAAGTTQLTLDGSGSLAVVGNMTAAGAVTAQSGNVAATLGNVTAGAHVTAVGAVTAVSGSMHMGAGGSGRIFQAAPRSWYWDWNSTTGTMIWMKSGAGQFWVMDATTNFCSNQLGPVGGVGAYVPLSDERTKQDIRPLDLGLDAILQINPISFTRIMNGRHEIGFSAQDVQRVIPDAVSVFGASDDDDAPLLGVSVDPIVAAMVNGMKELAERVTRLEEDA